MKKFGGPEMFTAKVNVANINSAPEAVQNEDSEKAYAEALTTLAELRREINKRNSVVVGRDIGKIEPLAKKITEIITEQLSPCQIQQFWQEVHVANHPDLFKNDVANAA